MMNYQKSKSISKDEILDKSLLPDKKIIRTPEANISINNPKKIAEEDTGPEQTILKSSQNFTIFYLKYDDKESFALSLSGENFEESRKQAEKTLLELLGISEEQACLLSVSEKVPYGTNPDLAGSSFPLSFCNNKLNK